MNANEAWDRARQKAAQRLENPGQPVAATPAPQAPRQAPKPAPAARAVPAYPDRTAPNYSIISEPKFLLWAMLYSVPFVIWLFN